MHFVKEMHVFFMFQGLPQEPFSLERTQRTAAPSITWYGSSFILLMSCVNAVGQFDEPSGFVDIIGICDPFEKLLKAFPCKK